MMKKGDKMLDYRTNTFITLCQCMNFTKAAQKLNLTQPAVSGHIKYLENFYQAKLFIRDKKSLVLTDQGKILYMALNSMANDQVKIKNIISKNTVKNKKISLGLTRTIGEFAVLDRLIEFISKEKYSDFYIHYKNTKDILEDLEKGKIDFAIIEGFLKSQNYYVKKFKSEKYICIANKNHKFRNKINNLSDLLSERLIIREEGSGTLAILKNMLAIQNLSLKDFKNIIQVNNMHAIVELLEKDCGISFLFESAVKKHLENKEFISVNLKDFKVSHDFSFVCNKNSIFIDDYLELFNSFVEKNKNT